MNDKNDIVDDDTIVAEENRLARLKTSNMPASTEKTHRLETFKKRAGAEAALAACRKFISSDREHHFLSFFAPAGTGKTHLALGIGWWWLDNTNLSFHYTPVEELYDKLRRTFNNKYPEVGDSFDVKNNYYKTVPLLILDDMEPNDESTVWAAAKIRLIIDHRYINQLLTVVISNVKRSALEPRIASRLSEGVCIAPSCSDYRPELARRRAKV